jgi:hypothetical protein
MCSGDEEDVSEASARCSSGLQSSGTVAVLAQAEFGSSVPTLSVVQQVVLRLFASGGLLAPS